MRSILLAFLLTMTLGVDAQDSRIFDNTWYLHYMVIDGVNRVPPTLPNTAYADFFSNGDLYTAYCPEETGATILTFQSNDEFTFPGIGWLAGGCYSPYSSNYNMLYQNFWNYFNSIFSYEIIENGPLRTLIITNPDMDIAIFGDTIVLENPNFDKPALTVSPNPVSVNLLIAHELASEIHYMEIVSITGQRIRTITSNFNSIDVTALSPGIYFLRIRDAENGWYVRKFVKH